MKQARLFAFNGDPNAHQPHLSIVMRRVSAYVEALRQRVPLLKHARPSVDHREVLHKPRPSMVMRRIGAHIKNLQERIRFLEAVVQNFPGGIAVYDSDMRMVLCNDRQKRLLDYPPEFFANGLPTMEDIFRFNAERGEYGPGDVQEQVSRRMRLAHEARPHVYERTRPNGTVLEVRRAPVEGGGFVTSYLDVTEQRRAQALVAHLTHHDMLTNLPNRALFADSLQNAILSAKGAELTALHYLDVDGFKSINDALGHEAGDLLLVAIAFRLTQAVSEHDIVARLGPDEFAVVQTGIKDTNGSAVLARRMSNEIERPIDIGGRPLEVTVSIGTAFAPLDGVTLDDLLRKAHVALHRSRSEGGGRFTAYGASEPELPASPRREHDRAEV